MTARLQVSLKLEMACLQRQVAACHQSSLTGNAGLICCPVLQTRRYIHRQ